MQPYSERFPNLFQPIKLGLVPQAIQFNVQKVPPPEALIANVNLVPFIDRECLVIYLSNGSWEIPGGTLEAGETYLEAIARELREEAGAKLLNFTVFGAWFCRSASLKPYRPHLPHPEYYRLVGYGDAALASSPLNPEDGEQVERVVRLPVEEAAENFMQQNRADLAELYQLAQLIRDKREIS